jgi:hypothetical protein
VIKFDITHSVRGTKLLRSRRIAGQQAFLGAPYRITPPLSAHQRPLQATTHHVPVPTLGPRMVCTRCGIIGADARPELTSRFNPKRLMVW